MNTLLLLPSIVCASLPMLAFLVLVWWLDRYDREPIWLVGVAFLWGSIGGVILSLIGSLLLKGVLLLGIFTGGALFATNVDWMAASVGPVIVAPLIEEPAKALILLLIIQSRHFDNMTDGFVYGAAAGLGFGMTENFMYFTLAEDPITWGITVFIRTFYSAVMHATATAVVGAALGFARFRGFLPILVCGAAGLVVAIGMHALWNGLLIGEDLVGANGKLLALNMLLFPLEVLSIFLLFQLCLLEESCTIRRELTEEVDAGRIPPEHPAILSSWFRRLGLAWLPPGVERDPYVQAATDLAMRKKQLRQLGRRASPFYKKEVLRLQREVERLLQPNVA